MFPQYQFASSLFTTLDMQRVSSYVTRLVQVPLCHPSLAIAPMQQAETPLISPIPQLPSLQPTFSPAACTIPSSAIVSSSASSASSSLVAAAVSDFSIKLYLRDATRTPPDLQPLCTLTGHTQPIHDLQWYNQHASYLVESALYAQPLPAPSNSRSAPATASAPTAPAAPTLPTATLPLAPLLFSASQDGRALAWDVRSGKIASTFRPSRRSPLFSVAAAEHLVVAGGADGVVFLWDVRTGRTLRTLADYHSDDVSCVAIHPLDHTQFFTGSLDNLVCRFDTRLADANEWCQDVYNGDNGVARIGFFGPRAEFLYCHTTVETLSLWALESGQCVANFADVRQRLSETTHRPVDYLIDCHYDSPTDRLWLACGDNNGGMVFAHVRADAVQPFSVVHSHSTVDWNRVDDRDVNVSASASASASASTDGVNVEMDTMQASGEVAEGGVDEDEDDDGDGDGDGDGDSSTGQHMDGGEDDNASMSDDTVMAADATVDPHLVAEAALPGHVACIRGIAWCSPTLIVTGAQDSRVCCWSAGASAGAGAGSNGSSLGKASKSKARRVRDDPESTLGVQAAARNRYSPY